MQAHHIAALEAALAAVKVFSEPVTQPIFGVRIYAPDSSDTSALACVTREVMQLASREQRQAEIILSRQPSVVGERFDESLYSRLEANLPTTPDGSNLAKYLAAIRHLALALDEAA